MTSRKIHVRGKQQVMQVLLDPHGNYSVSGYAARMERSFGLIFLGRDANDPEYARQSAEANRAIGMISEREAFTRAVEATLVAVQPLRRRASVDMKAVSDKVLAMLCTQWFDLPDGDYVVANGSALPLPPGRCPGHFAAPSGYIFQPEPGWPVRLFGRWTGRLLRRQVAKFVARQRASGIPPRGDVARALFAAFPDTSAENELLTRTLIGVMIGFLPTTQGNLMAVAEAWAGGTFIALKAAYLANPEPDPYLRAQQVIGGALVAAMQKAPMPPAIWRTALRDHVLEGDPPIEVKAGDRLFIHIDSATQEDLGEGIADPMPIFGGDRSQMPRPTHACPGFEAGMGVLLGTFAGLMKAGPAVRVDGWLTRLLAPLRRNWLRITVWSIVAPVAAFLLALGGFWTYSEFWDKDKDRGALALPEKDDFGDHFDRVMYLATAKDKGEVEAEQGWNAAESLWFYNTTQGSNLLPYDFFMVLDHPTRPGLFRDDRNINHYRYLPQKPTRSNPDGLPVGFVKDEYQGREYIGLTCAACHTSQVNFRVRGNDKGRDVDTVVGVRIDGGPSAADMQGFIGDLARALRIASDDQHVREKFLVAVRKRRGDAARDEDILEELATYSHRLNTYFEANKPSYREGAKASDYGYARLDAFGRIYNRVLEHVLNTEDGRPLERAMLKAFEKTATPGMPPKARAILDGPRRDHMVERILEVLDAQQRQLLRDALFSPANAPVSYPFLWDIPHHDYVQWNGLAPNAGLGPVGRNTGEAIGVFGTQDWKTDRKPWWNLYGHLYTLYTGQGFFTSPYIRFTSSVNVRNLGRLEQHLWKLKSPRWPRDLAPLPDDHGVRAARGALLFGDYCAACHAPIRRADKDRRVVAHLSRLEDIGTDPAMAENSVSRAGLSGIVRNQYVKAGPGDVLLDERAPVAAILTKVTQGVVATPDPDRGYLLGTFYWGLDLVASLFANKIKPSLKSGNYDPDSTAKPYESLRAYKGRSLNGIWATAPYLHNGSVPTLHDLLLPKDPAHSADGKSRPEKFMVGSREFDPVKVGFRSEGYAGFEFNTRLPGNDNGGHEYGARRLMLNPDWSIARKAGPDGKFIDMTEKECAETAGCRVLKPLSPDAREDLLAYLKTLGDEDPAPVETHRR